MEDKTKWYKSNFGIIALLILFFPVGIFLMWKYANWNKKAKWVITGIFVLLIAFGALGDKNKAPEEQKNDTIQASTQPETANFYFDVPSLVGKDLDEVQTVLGTPKGIDPTTLQIQLGAKEWDKTFVKDGHELLVTYTISNKKIVDFFISADGSNSGKTKDKNRLLEMGNLKENDPKYKIEFVKVINDPTYFTGVKVIPN